jgi:biotin carboxyl carrier protein
MKITVKVAGETFDVEIEDLAARPVRARIGEERFEIWPEPADAPPTASAAAPPRPRIETVEPNVSGANAVLAPLPGVLISVAVQPGDVVTVGQPLCVLEAMKMNNTVRAARAGRIAAVRAVVGQAVRHRQVLVEYAAACPETA